jgi:hypothetical protein
VFVAVTTLFVLIALVGFLPSSAQKIAAVAAGQRPPFQPMLHVHAASMGAWLLLLATQAGLAATGRQGIHRALGMGSLVLVPVMVVSGFILVPATFQWVWAMVTAPPPGMDAGAVEQIRTLITHLPLVQFRAGFTFLVLFSCALLLRRSDPQNHRRLMVLATAAPLLAAVDRIAWLPTTMPGSPVSLETYNLLLILPLFIHDVVRERRVPAAYKLWLAVNLPLAVAMHGLWGTSWWAAMAPRLMGFDG